MTIQEDAGWPRGHGAQGEPCGGQGPVPDPGRLTGACCRHPNNVDWGWADHGGLECHTQDVGTEGGDERGISEVTESSVGGWGQM